MTVVVGLIGGIGCGKSTVSSAFSARNAMVFHADPCGHRALSDPAIKTAVEARWGKTVFTSTGNVLRKALAKIVFSDEKELEYLNQLVHPFIINQFLQCLKQAQESNVAIFVVDAPLLLETGMDKYCDHIIFIDTNEENRHKRVFTRGWSLTEFQLREKTQISLEEKRKKSDYVIDNNTSLAKMEEQVSLIIEKLTVLP